MAAGFAVVLGALPVVIFSQAQPSDRPPGPFTLVTGDVIVGVGVEDFGTVTAPDERAVYAVYTPDGAPKGTIRLPSGSQITTGCAVDWRNGDFIATDMYTGQVARFSSDVGSQLTQQPVYTIDYPDVSSPESVAILGNGDFLVSSAEYVFNGGGAGAPTLSSDPPPLLRRYSDLGTLV